MIADMAGVQALGVWQCAHRPLELHAPGAKQHQQLLHQCHHPSHQGLTMCPAACSFQPAALLPGETMALNIFEPRYRLLVRRCMEGSRRLGMAQQAASAGQGVDGIDDVACEAEITECQAAPDG
jgi:hypothetical protein